MVVVNNADTLDVFQVSNDDEAQPVLPCVMIRCRPSPNYAEKCA
jgi:hypothetical protein